jgi:hypothetical protein
LAKLKERLTQLHKYAEYYNTHAFAFFEVGTPHVVFDQAVKILGQNNVMWFTR